MSEIRDMRDRLFNSMQENLDRIFHSSGLELPPGVGRSIGEILDGLILTNPEGADILRHKKTPDNLGDDLNMRGHFNVIPATNNPYDITDTLVVFCLGSDNLNKRVDDMLIAVGRHSFRNVIFVTTKWDISAVTGGNNPRLHDLIEFSQRPNGSQFCFIMLSTCGIGSFPVV